MSKHLRLNKFIKIEENPALSFICFFTADRMWSAFLCSYQHAFPAMMSWTTKLSLKPLLLGILRQQQKLIHWCASFIRTALQNSELWDSWWCPHSHEMIWSACLDNSAGEQERETHKSGTSQSSTGSIS